MSQVLPALTPLLGNSVGVSLLDQTFLFQLEPFDEDMARYHMKDAHEMVHLLVQIASVPGPAWTALAPKFLVL